MRKRIGWLCIVTVVSCCGLLLFGCVQQPSYEVSSQTDQETQKTAQITRDVDKGRTFPAEPAQKDQYSLLHNQVLEKLETMTPGESILVRLEAEKERYNTGDLLEIRFQINKACYATLMDVSTDGEIRFLLPNSQFAETKLQEERIYSTLYDFGMKMIVTPPEGIETINLFCIAEEFNLFEAEFEKESVYTINPNDEERLTDLLAKLEQLKNYEWSGQSLQFEILKEGLALRRIPKKYGAIPPIRASGTTGKTLFPDAQGK